MFLVHRPHDPAGKQQSAHLCESVEPCLSGRLLCSSVRDPAAVSRPCCLTLPRGRHTSAVKVPRAVAVVTEGSRVLLIKRFFRQESSVVCVMCEDGGRPGP